MRQTRKIAVSERVFTSQDLLRIAKIFAEQDKPPEQHVSTEYEVKFEDNTTIESDSPDVFSDESLTAPARPVAIRMWFRNYALGHHISLSLEHGDASYGNVGIVSASEPRPQEFWFRRHKVLLLNLIALGIGSLGTLIIDLAGVFLGKVLGFQEFVVPLPPDSPWRQILSAAQPMLYAAGWLWRWAAGFFWGAFEVRRWLLATWPGIEFEFGLPHLQAEKVRRGRLKAVAALVIFPIVTTVLYDLVKRAF